MKRSNGAVRVFYLTKLLVATVLSGSAAWLTLAALSALRVWRTVEAFTADPGFGDESSQFMALFDETVRAMQGGAAVFIGAAVAGVVLSEILGTRSLLYYMAVAGALAVLLAAGLTPIGPQTLRAGSSAIAIAGFAGGVVYWFVRGRAVGFTGR